MGTYCTTTSLETMWIGAPFTDLTGAASAIIDDAEAEIDKRLSVKYDVSGWTTSAATPPAVQTICKWLALGYLYEATARGSSAKEAYARADRYIKKAQQNITDILEGDAALVDSSGDIIESDSDDQPIHCNTTDYAPTFNEDSPLNWGVDPDKLDDIDDERD